MSFDRRSTNPEISYSPRSAAHHQQHRGYTLDFGPNEHIERHFPLPYVAAPSASNVSFAPHYRPNTFAASEVTLHDPVAQFDSKYLSSSTDSVTAPLNIDSKEKYSPPPTKDAAPVEEEDAEEKIRRHVRIWQWKIKRHLARWMIYASALSIVLLAAGAGFAAYKKETTQAMKAVESPDTSRQNGIGLVGQMASIDVFKQEVVINWFYVGYGNYTRQAFTGDYLLNRDLEVYVNGDNDPAGLFNASHESVYVTQTFSTKHRSSARLDKLSAAAAITYPFDQYQFNASFALSDTHSTRTLPLISVEVASTIQGWSSIQSQTPNLPYIGPDFSGNGTVINIVFGRSTATRAFTVIIAILMWCISLAVLYNTINFLILRRFFWSPLISVFSSVLFALPALRNTMPGVPMFGTYADVYGFLVNEILVGVCLVSLILGHARTDIVSGANLPAPLPNKAI